MFVSQQQGAQLVTTGGYNVVQPMQAVTVDGQEALFIPAMPAGQHQAVQLAGGQALITPTGQIIRAPGVYPTSLVQNVQMSNGMCQYNIQAFQLCSHGIIKFVMIKIKYTPSSIHLVCYPAHS